MSYGQYGDMSPARPGLPDGSNHKIDTKYAKEAIGYGEPVFVVAGEDYNAYLPVQDSVVMTFAGDFVASNVITSVVTLDGVAFSDVVTNWDTDQATTLAALIADLTALTGVTAVAGTAARAINLSVAAGSNISIVSTVTLGAGQTTASYVYSTSLLFGGVAIVDHKEGLDINGDRFVEEFGEGELLGAVTDKDIWVTVPSGVTSTANRKAYVIANADDADYKKFTTSATNTYGPVGYFTFDPVNALAVVRLDGIK